MSIERAASAPSILRRIITRAVEHRPTALFAITFEASIGMPPMARSKEEPVCKAAEARPSPHYQLNIHFYEPIDIAGSWVVYEKHLLGTFINCVWIILRRIGSGMEEMGIVPV
ncbi:MAG: hypothetical protein ACRD2O_03050 [Terriglobia bacterium]